MPADSSEPEPEPELVDNLNLLDLLYDERFRQFVVADASLNMAPRQRASGKTTTQQTRLTDLYALRGRLQLLTVVERDLLPRRFDRRDPLGPSFAAAFGEAIAHDVKPYNEWPAVVQQVKKGQQIKFWDQLKKLLSFVDVQWSTTLQRSAIVPSLPSALGYVRELNLRTNELEMVARTAKRVESNQAKDKVAEKTSTFGELAEQAALLLDARRRLTAEVDERLEEIVADDNLDELAAFVAIAICGFADNVALRDGLVGDLIVEHCAATSASARVGLWVSPTSNDIQLRVYQGQKNHALRSTPRV